MAKQQSGKSEATRANLLAAALKVIGQQGYDGASIDSIAKEAGVSKGVVYYYFSTKADVATNVLISAFDGLITSFERIVAINSDPHDALEKLVQEFAHLIYGNREASRFILSEIWRPERAWSDEMHQIEERMALLIEKLLKKGMDEGIIRKELDLRFVAVATVGIVLTSAQYYLTFDDSTDEESFTWHCIDFIRNSLSAH